MRKLLKHLKPYTATIVVIIGFLIVQATCDLSLPSYTSDIVNVGIQQGGIDEKIPEAVKAGKSIKVQKGDFSAEVSSETKNE